MGVQGPLLEVEKDDLRLSARGGGMRQLEEGGLTQSFTAEFNLLELGECRG